jgi:putative hydrolase of the HAD superfamily
VKPDPSIFLHAAFHLGVGKGEVVILEDSLNGLRAAQAAGIRCIAAPSAMTRHLDFSGAWRRVPSLESFSLEGLQGEW